jgi:hypothetical protein
MVITFAEAKAIVRAAEKSTRALGADLHLASSFMVWIRPSASADYRNVWRHPRLSRGG